MMIMMGGSRFSAVRVWRSLTLFFLLSIFIPGAFQQQHQHAQQDVMPDDVFVAFIRGDMLLFALYWHIRQPYSRPFREDVPASVGCSASHI